MNLRTHHLLCVAGVLIGISALACGTPEEKNNSTNNPKDCGVEQKMCNPDDPKQIIYKDKCDNIRVVQTCTATKACATTDPKSGLEVTPRCLAKCGDQRAAKVCDPNDLSAVFFADECGEITTKSGSCSQSLTCVDGKDGADAACECTPVTTGEVLCNHKFPGQNAGNPYLESYVVTKYTCNMTSYPESAIVETCEFGTDCFQDDRYNNGISHCTRSFKETQKDSLYYNHGCFSFPEFVGVKTDLPVDCRCRIVGDGGMGTGLVNPLTGERPGNAIANCLSAPTLPNQRPDFHVPIGSGPFYGAFKDGTNYFLGGGIEPTTRELYALALWSDPTYQKTATILATNVDTGARRIVSGVHKDPAQGAMMYGSGYETPRLDGALQPLTGHNVLRIGPNKQLFTLGVGTTGEATSRRAEIVKTDPQSGKRTLIWRSQTVESGDLSATYGQCLTHYPDAATGFYEHLTIGAAAFAVAKDGKFYLAFHAPKEGDGLLEISEDGKNCRVISRWGAEDFFAQGTMTNYPAPTNIGTGFLPQYGRGYGMMVRNGHLYVMTKWDDFMKVNITSGDRLNVSSSAEVGGSARRTMFYDDTRDLFWIVGAPDRYAGVIIDEKTGRREPVFSDSTRSGTPLMKSEYSSRRSYEGVLSTAHNLTYGAFELDPNDNNKAYMLVAVGAVVAFEFSSFNSAIISY